MDSDEEIDEVKVWKGVPGTIILINAFGNSKYNIFPVAHVATCRLIRQYLRLSSYMNVSVCIYGAEEPTNSTIDSKSVIEIFPLTMPTLADFKKLKNFDVSPYPEAKELKLSDVLWHCSKMFSNFKKQLKSRTIIMLTDLRTPPIGADHKPTLKKVMDLVDSNIEIKVINISNEDYKIDPFYEHFLLEASKGQDYKLPLPKWDSQEIEKLMQQNSHRHLADKKLEFEIGNGLSIDVGIYSLLRRSGDLQQRKANLDRDTNAIVSSVTNTMKVSTAKDEEDDSETIAPKKVPLLKCEIVQYQIYGGEQIYFTDKEVESIRNPFGPPMLKLLGFKPARLVCKEKWYFRMTYFLFPNETSMEGSTVAFKALHKACQDMAVVAICVLCTRVNSKPVIVALSPTTRPLGIDAEIGFDMITIPFVENVREMPNFEDNDPVIVDDACKSVMNDILETMSFEYKADTFENPKLQSQYRALESIALEEEDLEPFIDTTLRDPKDLKNIREDLFEELFGPFGGIPVKRPASSNEPGNSKKTKIENIDEKLLLNRIASQQVQLYNVAQLKEILKYRDIKGIPALTGLKKVELVELVYKFCPY